MSVHPDHGHILHISQVEQHLPPSDLIFIQIESVFIDRLSGIIADQGLRGFRPRDQFREDNGLFRAQSGSKRTLQSPPTVISDGRRFASTTEVLPFDQYTV